MGGAHAKYNDTNLYTVLQLRLGKVPGGGACVVVQEPFGDLG